MNMLPSFMEFLIIFEKRFFRDRFSVSFFKSVSVNDN